MERFERIFGKVVLGVWKAHWQLSGIACIIVFFGEEFLPEKQAVWFANACLPVCKIAIYGFMFEVIIAWMVEAILDGIKKIKKLKTKIAEKQKA